MCDLIIQETVLLPTEPNFALLFAQGQIIGLWTRLLAHHSFLWLHDFFLLEVLDPFAEGKKRQHIWVGPHDVPSR